MELVKICTGIRALRAEAIIGRHCLFTGSDPSSFFFSPACLCACSFLASCCLHPFFFLLVSPSSPSSFASCHCYLRCLCSLLRYGPSPSMLSIGWANISIESLLSLVGPRFSHSTDRPPSLELPPTIHLSLSQLSRRRLSYSRFRTLLQIFSNNPPSPRFPTSFMSAS